MPAELQAHVRYPEDIFKTQRLVYSRYHVTDPGSFYSGQDFWYVPTDPTQQAAGKPATAVLPDAADARSGVPGVRFDHDVLAGQTPDPCRVHECELQTGPGYGKLRVAITAQQRDPGGRCRCRTPSIQPRSGHGAVVAASWWWLRGGAG